MTQDSFLRFVFTVLVVLSTAPMWPTTARAVPVEYIVSGNFVTGSVILDTMALPPVVNYHLFTPQQTSDGFRAAEYIGSTGLRPRNPLDNEIFRFSASSQVRQGLDVMAFYVGSYENPSRLSFFFLEQEFVSCCGGVRFGGATATPVPEPGTLGLLVLPLLGLMAARVSRSVRYPCISLQPKAKGSSGERLLSLRDE